MLFLEYKYSRQIDKDMEMLLVLGLLDTHIFTNANFPTKQLASHILSARLCLFVFHRKVFCFIVVDLIAFGLMLIFVVFLVFGLVTVGAIHVFFNYFFCTVSFRFFVQHRFYFDFRFSIFCLIFYILSDCIYFFNLTVSAHVLWHCGLYCVVSE